MSPRMRRLTAREGVNLAESTQRIPNPQVGARENRGSPFLSKTFIACHQNRVYHCILGRSVPDP
jgi:hypothetical protein